MKKPLYTIDDTRNQHMTEEPFITIKTADNRELTYRKSTIEQSTVLKELLEDLSSDCIDLSKSNLMVANSAILKSLFTCIKEPSSIKKVDPENLITLFLTAHELEAPENIIGKIAYQICVLKLDKDADKTLQRLLRNYYRSLQTLVDEKKVIKPTNTLNLSHCNLKSLTGITELAETIEPEIRKKIERIDLSHNLLETIDQSLKYFKTLFPNIGKINLSYNQLKEISPNILSDADILIDISHNRIESINTILNSPLKRKLLKEKIFWKKDIKIDNNFLESSLNNHQKHLDKTGDIHCLNIVVGTIATLGLGLGSIYFNLEQKLGLATDFYDCIIAGISIFELYNLCSLIFDFGKHKQCENIYNNVELQFISPEFPKNSSLIKQQKTIKNLRGLKDIIKLIQSKPVFNANIITQYSFLKPQGLKNLAQSKENPSIISRYSRE